MGRETDHFSLGGRSSAARSALACSSDPVTLNAYPSLIERGLRQPTLSMLLRLAYAIDTEPTKLVEDTLANLQVESLG
ncbi:MAG: hypothetical protein JWL65_2233 [Gammaproteobacteria bacterium]|nr:hypothetical protein [Gammaproteobacteria bacterium]